MLPQAHDLEYFLEVVIQKNISRAAQRLGISQPTLSVSIQRLEESLGAPLLLRSKNGVELTKAGRLFSARAKKIIEDWHHLKSETLQSQEDLSGVYTLGCHPSVALYTLPKFFASLLNTYPHLELKLIHDLSRKITDEVIQFKIDFALAINPVRHPDLVLSEILRDEVRAWSSPLLAKNPHNLRTLICDPDLIQTQVLIEKYGKAGFKFDRIVSSSSLEVIASLCASGAGVAILPTRVATLNSLHKLKAHSELKMTYEDRLYLVYRADFNKSAASKKLSEFISMALKDK